MSALTAFSGAGVATVRETGMAEFADVGSVAFGFASGLTASFFFLASLAQLACEKGSISN